MSPDLPDLLNPNESVRWAGRPSLRSAIRPFPIIVFLIGIGLAYFGAVGLANKLALHSAFRGTAFENFWMTPSFLLSKPALMVALGLFLAHFLPSQLWSLSRTRYYLSDRRAFLKQGGFFGTRYLAATISPYGNLEVGEVGKSYTLTFEAQTNSDHSFPVEFAGLSQEDFKTALAHLKALTNHESSLRKGDVA